MNATRNEQIKQDYAAGTSLTALARRHGISRQRIMQIVKPAATRRGPKPVIPLDLYQWIIEYKRDNDGNSPALQDIIDAGHAGSTSVAGYKVRQLVDAGLLTTRGNKARQICVVGAQWIAPGAKCKLCYGENGEHSKYCILYEEAPEPIGENP